VTVDGLVDSWSSSADGGGSPTIRLGSSVNMGSWRGIFLGIKPVSAMRNSWIKCQIRFDSSYTVFQLT
jgi:hypothetical protein